MGFILTTIVATQCARHLKAIVTAARHPRLWMSPSTAPIFWTSCSSSKGAAVKVNPPVLRRSALIKRRRLLAALVRRWCQRVGAMGVDHPHSQCCRVNLLPQMSRRNPQAKKARRTTIAIRFLKGRRWRVGPVQVLDKEARMSMRQPLLIHCRTDCGVRGQAKDLHPRRIVHLGSCTNSARGPYGTWCSPHRCIILVLPVPIQTCYGPASKLAGVPGRELPRSQQLRDDVQFPAFEVDSFYL